MPYRIELAAEVGRKLEHAAAVRGMATTDLVAALLATVGSVETDSSRAKLVVELKAQSARPDDGEPTYAHDDVCRWLSTWGTADYKPWPGVE